MYEETVIGYPGSSAVRGMIRLLTKISQSKAGAIALAFGAATLVYSVFKTAKHQREEERLAEDLRIDVVDEASWESFPASDPPSYTPAGV